MAPVTEQTRIDNKDESKATTTKLANALKEEEKYFLNFLKDEYPELVINGDRIFRFQNPENSDDYDDVDLSEVPDIPVIEIRPNTFTLPPLIRITKDDKNNPISFTIIVPLIFGTGETKEELGTRVTMVSHAQILTIDFLGKVQEIEQDAKNKLRKVYKTLLEILKIPDEIEQTTETINRRIAQLNELLTQLQRQIQELREPDNTDTTTDKEQKLSDINPYEMLPPITIEELEEKLGEKGIDAIITTKETRNASLDLMPWISPLGDW